MPRLPVSARDLDYMKGVGLEQNAAVIVHQPDQGHAWVNISYAGFIGSVTAMNAKHISIGEMGGRGEGQWDGKPMAQLIREVMEKAGTLDADGTRDLMTRPVCINSNIHSVLFAPDTLDFWVANADSNNPASHTRYTRYNLTALLAGAATTKVDTAAGN